MNTGKGMYIEYTFTMQDKQVLSYNVPFNRQYQQHADAEYPAWTLIDFEQCSNCPLDKSTHKHCPIAIDAHEIIAAFNDILSFNETDVHVKTPERDYSKHCDAQTGLRSLIGFVMATSACPVLTPLRGMAHYHLPFASLDETLYRVASSYLLGQYYAYQETGKADLELNGLKAQFLRIQTVNHDFLSRVRSASKADSSLDVLSTLFSISTLISFNLEDYLTKLKPLFLKT